MAKLRADTAAQVAATLTQARMTLLGGILAGRQPGAKVEVSGNLVEETFQHFLAFAIDLDPKSVAVGATLDLTQSSIIPGTD